MTRQPASLRRAAARLPGPVQDALRRLGLGGPPNPRWGNLRRTQPFSAIWGFDRGLPVDRRYIEGFLEEHAADVRGESLEVNEALYTRRYGGARLTATNVLDIDPANPNATIVGDLCDEQTLPEGRFDCFVLTQTLQFVADPEAALANAYRSLAPGGVLLLTVPTTSRADGPADRWRWTPAGLEELLGRCLPAEAEREVTGRGNVLTGVAFLMGLAASELRDDEYADDPLFPLVVCARVRRP